MTRLGSVRTEDHPLMKSIEEALNAVGVEIYAWGDVLEDGQGSVVIDSPIVLKKETVEKHGDSYYIPAEGED